MIKFSSFVWNYLISKKWQLHQAWVFSKRPAPIEHWTKGALTCLKISLRGVDSLHSSSVHISISWLRKLLVGNHLVLKTDQDFFHGVGWIPIFEHVELGWLDSSVCLIDARKINLWVEFDCWCLTWIIFSTSDAHHVNSVVEVCVWWPNDCSIPVCETFVVTLGKT